MTCGPRIWLSRRSPKLDRFPGRWQAAGGSVEPGESPLDGALRELREETALHVPSNRLLYAAYDPRVENGIGGWTSLFYFHLALQPHEKPQRTEPDRHGPWRLFTKEQTAGLDKLDGLDHPACGFWIAREGDA